MTKTCEQLFAGIANTILGNAQVEVSGIAYRSDQVRAGDAFFCIVGTVVDGHTFAQDAIDRGASVIVAERKVYLADATDVCEVIVPDTRAAMAAAAAAFYDQPSGAFSLVGITGTNGKTTTTYLVEHIARELGQKTGIIGTVGIEIDGVRTPSAHTTPESPDLQRIFASMREAGVGCVAMEVSSHALDLGRTRGAQFAVTAFTNLTQDHLDYHHTFEDYFEAKARLFSAEYPARRVVGIDSKWGAALAERCRAAGDALITTGFDAAADVHPLSVDYGVHSTHIVLSVEGVTCEFTYPLVGKFNVENVMTAFAVALSLGFEPDKIAAALESARPVPGRLELVRASAGAGTSANASLPAVYVDYAHTPDALEKAISSVKALAEASGGRTIVVFGCGGDRDATKRPIMGAAALAADFAIVTSDNPRTENPAAIIADIEAGMTAGAGRYIVEPDRAAAIARAIDMASAADCVLLAGKGHEDYQIFGTEKVHFDDREQARAALEAKAEKA